MLGFVSTRDRAPQPKQPNAARARYITPEGANRLSRVWMFDDGEMVVAGGGGEMWIYASP